MSNTQENSGLLFSASQLMGLDDACIEPTEPIEAKPHSRVDRVRAALTDYFKLHGCGKNKMKRKI